MNWMRALIAGIVGGIVLTAANFVMHGMMLGSTYMKYPVFTQEEASPLYFLLIALCMAIAAAILFAKTRACWGEGLVGGAVFGFFLGLVLFFVPFYSPLVFEGFPYYLAWCQGGVNLIGLVILGAVLGLLYKKS